MHNGNLHQALLAHTDLGYLDLFSKSLERLLFHVFTSSFFWWFTPIRSRNCWLYLLLGFVAECRQFWLFQYRTKPEKSWVVEGGCPANTEWVSQSGGCFTWWPLKKRLAKAAVENQRGPLSIVLVSILRLSSDCPLALSKASAVYTFTSSKYIIRLGASKKTDSQYSCPQTAHIESEAMTVTEAFKQQINTEQTRNDEKQSFLRPARFAVIKEYSCSTCACIYIYIIYIYT